MRLGTIDWVVILVYFLLNIAVGLYFRRKAGTGTGEFFRLGPRRGLVAGRHLHGRHDFFRRYASGRHGTRGQQRHRRKLALVELCIQRDDDGVFVRPPLAPLRGHHRR